MIDKEDKEKFLFHDQQSCDSDEEAKADSQMLIDLDSK